MRGRFHDAEPLIRRDSRGDETRGMHHLQRLFSGNARALGRRVIVLWTSAEQQGRSHRPPGGLGPVEEPTPRMSAPSRGCSGR